MAKLWRKLKWLVFLGHGVEIIVHCLVYSVFDDVISPCVYVGALETSTSLMRVSTRVEHPMKADSPNRPLSSLFTVCLSVCLSHVYCC